MKQIKVLVLILVLSLTPSLYSQSKNTSLLKHKALVAVDFDTTIVDINITFDTLDIFANSSKFSIYNETTKLNDNYTVVNNNYKYDSSNKVLENSQRGYKIDSFNPYGASNVASAVGLGVINGLLKKIQK